MTNHLPAYLRPADLATRWHRSVKSLANDRSAGRGCPFVKIGGSVLYASADVIAYEEAHRVDRAA